MSVRAKFKVQSITRSMSTRKIGTEGGVDKYGPCEVRTVKLAPVYSNDPKSENAKFWDATPQGSIELGCANLEAAEQFEMGQEFYIDFTPAS